MRFKEQLNKDLRIFFDLEECAEEHVFAGRNMLVICDREHLQKRREQTPGGIFEGDLMLFIKTADLKGLRVHPERSVEFDRKPYRVVSCTDQDGITQVVLQAWEGI